MLIELIRIYGNKIMFVANINQYVLKIISQISSINTCTLYIVFCKPFDARKLRDLILIRHRARGMVFNIKKYYFSNSYCIFL